ncbi:lysophospholipid acyltransferase family protein [Ferrigenium sp. UT5]|uniref:lysophospholipid acyltransferase family protein n=1 Tax=Ferrigenium sp. UT5 TaxID=3242105 RepID=UPI00354DF37D
MGLLFDVLARMPLRMLHWLGGIIGGLTYMFSARYAAHLRTNLRQSGLAQTEVGYRRLLHASIREVGKGGLELAWIWRRPLLQVLASVKACHGWEDVEAAQRKGDGIIMLTPHLGCFEVVSLYIGAHMPMTIMYRAPRWASLDRLMHLGRARGQIKLVGADLGGVRQVFKTLKQGGVIGVLPDQAPGNGEGEWTPFFGRPAYTMTLVGRLIEMSHPAVFMCVGERLPHGAGYELHFSPLQFDPAGSIPQQMNVALEQAISKLPAQYLWSYNRYKVPRGALPPDADGES